MTGDTRPLARIRALLRAGEAAAAEQALGLLVGDLFDLPVRSVAIRQDGYSLNSVNGTVRTAEGTGYFFKFHQEEDEESTVAEYYRAELLDRAGYPVDRPLFVSREVGRQLLLYRQSPHPRFVDVCRAAEDLGDPSVLAPLIAAQQRLDALLLDRALATLHDGDAEDLGREPVLQLFAWRLVDRPGSIRPGGRAVRFYQGSRQRLPGLDLPFEHMAALRWEINGVRYRHTLAELFDESRRRLLPHALPSYPAVVAHGDAHNANVWYRADRAPPDLTLFDPAFAGRHVPALLAEVKTTFHNILAHPLWLYAPAEADRRFTVRASVAGDTIRIDHDWTLPTLRRAFLASKGERFWRPLLDHLRSRGRLPADWERFVRCALFCCPTLVMNLTAGAAGHTPVTAALGFAIAVMAGSEPDGAGDDPVAGFFAALH